MIVQDIIRDVERSLHTSVVTRNAMTIDLLQKRRARSLVFVSDYAGSGEESLAYARAWLRNATIRSWRSLKLIRLHLVLFAATTAGLRRIRASGLYDGVSVLHRGMDLPSAQWHKDELGRIRKLCEDYARRTEDGPGWSGSEGLLVFEHTVPNNLPSILRQAKGRTRRPDGQWAPFFEHRTAPPGLMHDLVGYRPERHAELGLRGMGRVQLTGSGKIHVRYRGGIRDLVEVFGHIKHGASSRSTQPVPPSASTTGWPHRARPCSGACPSRTGCPPPSTPQR
ncbi:phosphoribosyltransferase-like protein [Streptomyces sp. NPDC001233]